MEPGSAPWRVLEASDSEAPPDRESPDRRVPWPAIAVAVLAVAAGAGAIMASGGDEPVIGVDGASAFGALSADVAPTGAVSPRPEAVVVVDVGGAVVRPGVYRLPAGARVADAVDAAGGYAATVDASLVDRELNLAAPVTDGQKIRVPVRGEDPPAGGMDPGGETPGGTGPIDLNRASAEALDTLPGVGPVTVAKIIAAREELPFTSVDDLVARKVVGAATMEKLRPLVIVGP